MSATAKTTLEFSAKGIEATNASIRSVAASVDRMRKMQTQAVAVGNVLANVVTRAAHQTIAFARASLSAADNVSKSARAYGLSATAYQEMSFAAERSGVEMRALDTALRTMQSRMVQAGPIAKKLGVDFTKLADASPEEQFKAIGRTLAGIQNPAERTALAVEMFGRQGARIAQMAGDFEALSAEAHRLGIIMDDGALQVAERFNDQITNLTRRFQAFFVNALPNIKAFGQTWWTEIRFVSTIFKELFLLQFRLMDPTNWGPLIRNIGELMVTVFVNAFENLKRLISATKSWISGQGFNWDRVGLMDGAQLERVDAIDTTMGNIRAAMALRDERLGEISTELADSMSLASSSLQSSATDLAGTDPVDRSRGLEAAQFNSVEAARAIARFRESNRGDSIERRQLTVLEQIMRNTADIVPIVEEVAL
jgi:hypothetical protein